MGVTDLSNFTEAATDLSSAILAEFGEECQYYPLTAPSYTITLTLRDGIEIEEQHPGARLLAFGTDFEDDPRERDVVEYDGGRYIVQKPEPLASGWQLELHFGGLL